MKLPDNVSESTRKLNPDLCRSIGPPLESSESDLHNQIIEFCKSRNFIFLHGSMAHRTYRTLHEHDFTLLLPRGRVLFIECKSPKGKLSTGQQGMRMWMGKLQHVMHIVRTLSDFEQIVNQCLEDGTGSSSSFGSSELENVATSSDVNVIAEPPQSPPDPISDVDTQSHVDDSDVE